MGTGRTETPPFPIHRNGSGWNALLAARRPGPAPAGKRFTTIVIGAGYTGLAAARRLAELRPDEDILVVEAGLVGEGASGRNSGFLINLPHGPFPPRHADAPARQLRMFAMGLAWLGDIVSRHAIDCHWHPAGKYHGAASKVGVGNLRSALDTYRRWGIPCAELDAGELRRRLGTGYYRYGFIAHNNVFVQPAALIRGLADTLPANVHLAENEPVIQLDEGESFKVHTARADYVADKVIIANNGFAARLGYLADRLISMYTYAAITPPLPDGELAKLGVEDEWGLIPASRIGSTLRRIHGGRFMVRSGYSYGKEASAENAARLLAAVYQRRYPGMRSHGFEHVWGGTTALTRNGANVFGAIRKNLYINAGCNGTGVLKGTTYGRLLADLIAGHDSPELADALSLERASWLPPEPIRRIAVHTAIACQKVLTHAER